MPVNSLLAQVVMLMHLGAVTQLLAPIDKLQKPLELKSKGKLQSTYANNVWFYGMEWQ